VRGFVTLKRALIDDLLANGQTDAEHVAAGTLADEVADALAAAEGGTELHLEAFHAGIASGGDAGKMQRLGVIGEFLAGGVGDPAARTANKVGDGNAETTLALQTAVVVDHTDLGVVLGDNESVRKNGRVVANDPVEDFDGLLDDVSIWSRGWTSNDVIEIYNGGAAKKANALSTGTNGLIRYWPFDDGLSNSSATQALDTVSGTYAIGTAIGSGDWTNGIVPQ
jgi:hypothetical protein